MVVFSWRSRIVTSLFGILISTTPADLKAEPPAEPTATLPVTPTPMPSPESTSLWSSAYDSLVSGADKVSTAMKPYAIPLKDSAQASLEKIMAVEYKLVPLRGMSLKSIEEKLVGLGKDRWDCTPMNLTPPSIDVPTSVLYCKRVPIASYAKIAATLMNMQ